MSEKERLQALANMIAAEMKGAPPRPKLRLVGRSDLEKPICDSVTRECRLDRIRWLSSTFSLKWLVRQHIFGLASIDVLEDADLMELHREMEQARECIAEGIPLEDVGLIRTQAFEGTA